MPENRNIESLQRAHSVSTSTSSPDFLREKSPAKGTMWRELKTRWVSLRDETRISGVAAAVQKQVDKEIKLFEELLYK